MKFMDRFRLASGIMRNSWNDEVRKFFAGDDSLVTDAGFDATTRDAAMTNTAVFSCARVLAETIGSIPIQVYKKTDSGRVQVEDNNLYEMLHEMPNDEMTCQAFKEAGMMALNLGGNAFFQKQKNRLGEVIGLYPIAYENVEIERNPSTKRIQYRVTVDESTQILTRSEVFHVPAFSFDGICGLTPLAYCASSVALGKTYETYNKNFFNNGAFTSGIVEFPGTLSDLAFERFKKGFEESYKGLKNAGKPMILEDGGKFVPIKMTQADAQFMDAMRFQLEEVARIYRVPLTLLQDFGRATWNNMEQQQLFFVMFTILPWVKRWEENIKTQIMTKEQRQSGIYVEFQINNLLRGDAKTRAELYASGRQNGWLSVNDIRKLENMNPVEGGDTYMQPLNYININQADEYYEAQMESTEKKEEQTKAMAEEIYNILEKRGRGEI